jgi:hypothetical protein
MARHDLLLHSDAYSDVAETHARIDAETRTGLRRAFPLLAERSDDDETFRLLLAAISQRSGTSRPLPVLHAGNKS